jgi:DNA-binding PadR family transcriptional regulator
LLSRDVGNWTLENLYFQGFSMSSAQNLPNRTLILIKDLLFQEKYSLSHSQTDLMAYLVNVPYWANTVNGYFVIATAKIMNDLPNMGEKTIEASLKRLKELGLIVSKVVRVTEWNGKPYLRGIRLTKKGREYNAKLVLPSQDKEVLRLKEELKESRKMIEKLKNGKKSEDIQEERRIEPEKDEIDDFREKVTKVFSKNQKFICNSVESWEKETIFYINSYSRLCIIKPNKTQKQLKDPQEIHHFWEWLFKNPERIGNMIDVDKTPTLEELKSKYLDKTAIIKSENWKIHDIIAKNKLVKLQIRNQKGQICLLMDNKNSKKLFSLKRCEEILLEVLG